MTAGPTLEGVSDTFTFVCPCQATVHVAGGVEQPHDCPLTEAEKQAIREIGFDTEDVDDQAADGDAEQQPQGVDPLQVASVLCVNANNFLAKRDNPPVEKQIALAQAIATIELAQATRAQYQLNVQMAQMAVDDRNAAIARQAGPAGIVVPHLAPGR